MTGDLTCPMGPGMKLTAPATHQPLEIFGICEPRPTGVCMPPALCSQGTTVCVWVWA